MSVFAFSAFAICRDPDGFRGISRRLLESENNRARVIRFVFALVDGARQHERRGRRSLFGPDAVAVIDSKQNRRAALRATYAQIPSLISSGPLNIHGISLKVRRSGYRTVAGPCQRFATTGATFR